MEKITFEIGGKVEDLELVFNFSSKLILVGLCADGFCFFRMIKDWEYLCAKFSPNISTWSKFCLNG